MQELICSFEFIRKKVRISIIIPRICRIALQLP